MDESAVLCTAVNEGVECVLEATMTDPVQLCGEHQLQVALAVVPDVLATALRQSRTGLRPVTLAPDERAAVIAGARTKPVGAYMGGVHGPMVYFLDTGERVKIGHSTSLRTRVRAFSMQEKDVVLLLQGGLTLERALHAMFAKDRIDATEWFVKSEKLAAFIESKRADLDGQHRLKMQRQARKHMVPVPGRRADRLEIVRDLIRGVGGDPVKLPLKTIQDRFGVSQATASRMRSEAGAAEGGA